MEKVKNKKPYTLDSLVLGVLLISLKLSQLLGTESNATHFNIQSMMKEVDELIESIAKNGLESEETKSEIGDILFVAIQLALSTGELPEKLLSRTVKKLEDRLTLVEQGFSYEEAKHRVAQYPVD